ncbi:hypothetical protein RE428_43800 [Marinobacter nanhaiticus D15-8W]|uniref:Class I SAM-dependent methyltransferase n=1 Tax=Marinobacter nanhaiticus D15-8W TaxID=626887 RepID=N6VZS8_9GAMM|nr:class I SAM-dependent methyltransferase [Marinobacter nanhaiticus]ENO15780.1 class I SAM-dependent methyltransferase [Marinobacter nanhaiticus D15-8W]BES73362.1 hypothetical protein RE428_43800 [Marinobacter nanhaiticus D15-8W]
MDPFSDEKVIDAWSRNASQWTDAVRGRHIESRERVTNRAIVDAVLGYSPQSVLDVGCGEGWLVRALSERVNTVVGVDAIPSLIERARAAGAGDYRQATYEEIALGAVDGTFDVVVCNFSLIGRTSVEQLFSAIPSLLSPQGVLIVQTLHPASSCGDLPYQDGWREGSWAGFGAGFTDPAPWYFRTLGSWVALFRESRFQLFDMREPIHPTTCKPASVIFIAGLARTSLPG